jgi:RecA-family ATPase
MERQTEWQGSESTASWIPKPDRPEQYGNGKSSDAAKPAQIVIDEIPSVRSFTKRETVFIFPELIPQGTITLISGQPEAGKTTFTLHVCDAIAKGTKALGHVCQQHPVVYLTRENPLEYINDIV